MLGEEISLKYIIKCAFIGGASTQLYYIVVMIQLTLLTPILVRIKNRKWLYVITPIYFVYLYIYNIYMGEVPPLFGKIFPAWFIFYVFGMDCREGKFNNLANKINVWFVALAFALSLGESFLLLNVGCSYQFAQTQVRVGNFVLVMVIALFLVKIYNRKTCTTEQNPEEEIHKPNILAVVGDCSYGIFFSHMLVLRCVKKLMSYMPFSDIWLPYFLCCFIVTAILSFLFVWLVRKFLIKLNAKKLLMIIGF